MNRKDLIALAVRLEDGERSFDELVREMRLLSWPDEPKADGALVRDRDQDFWVRDPKDPDGPWTYGKLNRNWMALNVDYGPVEIIFEGIVTDQ